VSTGAEDWSDRDHVLGYLAGVDGMPHRAEGDGVLDEVVPAGALRILDLGCGDGRLSALLRVRRPDAHLTPLDVSPSMLTTRTRRTASSLRRSRSAGSVSSASRTRTSSGAGARWPSSPRCGPAEDRLSVTAGHRASTGV
jgi:SAM-dependent methyltransferase